MMQILSFQDVTVMPWKNGQGETREIYKAGGAHGDYDWRISIATITSPGPFSRFPGYLRNISVLEGGGMHLDVDGKFGPLILPFNAVDFAGECEVNCRVVDGPLLDFNVIYRADRFRATVEWNDKTDWQYCGGIRLLLNAGESLALQCAGERVLLHRYDCLLTDGSEDVVINASPGNSFARVTLSELTDSL